MKRILKKCASTDRIPIFVFQEKINHGSSLHNSLHQPIGLLLFLPSVNSTFTIKFFEQKKYFLLHTFLTMVYSKRKTWKDKKKISKQEKSDTYLVHVCRLPWSVECLKKIEKNCSFGQHCGFHQLQSSTADLSHSNG